MNALERVTKYLAISRNGVRLTDDAATVLAQEADTDLDVLAVAISSVQDLIRDARALEGVLTMHAGKVAKARDWAERQGNLPDGRQYRLHRTSDRKRWDHDTWKRDARKAVVADLVLADTLAPVEMVNPETGEVETNPLGVVLFKALADVQDFHGANPPKVGTLRAHDLDPQDYCEQTPGGWKFDAIAPTDHDQNED